MGHGGGVVQEEYELADARLKAEADDRRRQAGTVMQDRSGRNPAPGPSQRDLPGWRGGERESSLERGSGGRESTWPTPGAWSSTVPSSMVGVWASSGAQAGVSSSSPLLSTRTLLDHIVPARQAPAAQPGPSAASPLVATRTLMDHLPSELRGPDPSAAGPQPNAWANAWASRPANRPVANAWDGSTLGGAASATGEDWERAGSRRRGRRADGDADDGLGEAA